MIIVAYSSQGRAAPGDGLTRCLNWDNYLEESPMRSTPSSIHPIVPRQDLDFGLDGDIPKYWLDGDAFKTRFFDAMSTLFPEGERFFIACVRDYRDQISDPVLAAQVADFIRQEAQHGRVHTAFNARLSAQGVRVDRIEKKTRDRLHWFRQRFPKVVPLAQTAASEHMTAIMAHSFFERPEVFAGADPRIRAMYVWHGVEEIEHKAVAYEVMTNIANASYLTRVLAMIYVSLLFPLHTFMIVRHMLIVDGFSAGERLRIWARGLRWLYGRGGLFQPLMKHYFAYYRPGFNPWQEGEMNAYERWLAAFERTGDPVAAGDSAYAATS